MNIAGLVKNSLIDYPGKITAVVFTQGCNFRCPYCHNPDLVDLKVKSVLSEKEFFDFLDKRKGLLDAVTITGGEPTLQKDLSDFIRKVKERGFLVKLDSNGTNPRFLQRILDAGQVDYVAMDIKNSPERYAEVVGPVKMEKITESIDIIMSSGVEYEFRTTVLPKLHDEKSFEKIGEMIRGANKYFIQNFRSENTLDKQYAQESSFTFHELEKAKDIMEKYVKKCAIRENV